MIVDFSKSSVDSFSADVCIIGSGAAGFASALAFLESNLSVLLLEGGLKSYSEDAAALQQGEVIAHPHSGIHEARERIVGGTTTKWGGQVLPFMKEDFEKREHIELSGWPIALSDLLPYYQKAETVLGTDVAVPYNFNPWQKWGVQIPVIDKNKVELFVTKWCKIPNFSTQHSDTIGNSQNITLLTNANAVELIPNDDASVVAHIKIKTLTGKEGTISAKYIIAAGGAIETVRLFLNSTQFDKAGLGNKHGNVGLYFQDHVGAVVGQVYPKSRKHFQEIFDPFYQRGFKYFPRLRLNPDFAVQKKILHASAQVSFVQHGSNVLGAAKEIFSILKKKQKPSLGMVFKTLNIKGIKQVVGAALRWKFANRGSSPKIGPIWLEVHSEQNPDATSFVSLSDVKDALGMRRVKLNWTISQLTVKTITEMAKLVQKEFESSGLGEVKLEPWVLNPSIDPQRWMGDTFHQAGGLRMSVDDTTGVVDRNCKVHGIGNLYVASSAVFPTSSFSNPTMTTIALAIRITDEVKSKQVEDLLPK